MELELQAWDARATKLQQEQQQQQRPARTASTERPWLCEKCGAHAPPADDRAAICVRTHGERGCYCLRRVTFIDVHDLSA